MTKERAWALFYRHRESLRQYVAKNSITVTLLATACVVTWMWIFIVGVFF